MCVYLLKIIYEDLLTNFVSFFETLYVELLNLCVPVDFFFDVRSYGDEWWWHLYSYGVIKSFLSVNSTTDLLSIMDTQEPKLFSASHLPIRLSPPGQYSSFRQYNTNLCIPSGLYLFIGGDTFGDGWHQGSTRVRIYVYIKSHSILLIFSL